jgi:hypothetical protein
LCSINADEVRSALAAQISEQLSGHLLVHVPSHLWSQGDSGQVLVDVSFNLMQNSPGIHWAAPAHDFFSDVTNSNPKQSWPEKGKKTRSFLFVLMTRLSFPGTLPAAAKLPHVRGRSR